MKKFASLCVSFAFLMALAAPALAGDAPAAAAPAAPAPAAAPADVNGTVGAVDVKAMSLTVKDDKGEKTIFWNADTKVTLKDGKAGKSEDIKAGGAVAVKAEQKDGKWMAKEISLK
jgi:Cu/Ag efflux protein CusF